MATSATPRAPFQNEPFLDFSISEDKQRMEEALAVIESDLGQTYDLVLGGHTIATTSQIVSTNPARPSQVIGIHAKAEAKHVDAAVASAQAAFASWSRVPMSERADFLVRAAAYIRGRQFEFCAWLTYEVGKNWAEADADVGETIDFLEFYALEARRHGGRRRCRG